MAAPTKVREHQLDIPSLRPLRSMAILAAEYDAAQNVLSVRIASGIAAIGKAIVIKEAETVYTISTPSPSSSYHLFLGVDGQVFHSQDGNIPDNALYLGVINTGVDVSQVTVVDRRAVYSVGGGYVKPEGGIPLSDLASDVQSALQEVADARGTHLQLGDRLSDIESDVSSILQEISGARGEHPQLGDRLGYIESQIISAIAGQSNALQYHEVVATAGQTEISLPFSYTPGQNELLVFRNGVFQRVGAENDYIEANSNQITFTLPLSAGEHVVVIRLFKTNVVTYKQVTKLGVLASSTTPLVVDLNVTSDPDLRRPPVEVLKYAPGESGKVVTWFAFDSSDASSFLVDSLVTFDGRMYLKTQYELQPTNQGALGSGTLWTVDIDRTSFLAIEGLTVPMN